MLCLSRWLCLCCLEKRHSRFLELPCAETGVFSSCFFFQIEAEFLCLVAQFYNVWIHSGLILVLSMSDVALSKNNSYTVHPWGLVRVGWMRSGGWRSFPWPNRALTWGSPGSSGTLPQAEAVPFPAQTGAALGCMMLLAFALGTDQGLRITSFMQVPVLSLVCFFQGDQF